MYKKYLVIINIILIIVLSIAGSIISNKFIISDDFNKRRERLEKFHQILKYVSNFYVEEIDWDDSFEGAVDGFLSKLDPHSIYIPSSDAQINEENFQGKYQGIGIYFEIIEGYIPPRSVVISGSYTKEFPAGKYQVPCAFIIGQRKESTEPD